MTLNHKDTFNANPGRGTSGNIGFGASTDFWTVFVRYDSPTNGRVSYTSPINSAARLSSYSSSQRNSIYLDLAIGSNFPVTVTSLSNPLLYGYLDALVNEPAFVAGPGGIGGPHFQIVSGGGGAPFSHSRMDAISIRSQGSNATYGVDLVGRKVINSAFSDWLINSSDVPVSVSIRLNFSKNNVFLVFFLKNGQ